jgi:fatty acid desaturase
MRLLLTTHSTLLLIIGEVGLGLLFAHGLELQHEALHHNLFRSPAVNRVIGFLLGAPMLVSYTHYKVQHLHHHKYVGTADDRELFDYRADQLGSSLSIVSRAWNWGRIPTFLLTAIDLTQGRWPPAFRNTGAKRRHLRHEYAVLIIGLFGAVFLEGALHLGLFMLVWFVPWLLVAEPVHFLIELPEHVGCDTQTTNPLLHTRSYTTHWLWRYVANCNNYHVEHHMWPNIALHNLAAAHELIATHIRHREHSYVGAMSAVLRTLRSATEGSPRVSDARANESVSPH